jgi:hypothetical protein
MVDIINTSQSIGYGIYGLNSVTGSFGLTLLIIFIVALAIALMFRMPLEYVTIFLLPLALGFAVASNSFTPVLIVVLMFAGVMLAKHFFFNS